jgi:tetratricopeptide (TPR) repeat protein
VDEIVVVDTGSEDGSLEVARSFGAAVGEFAWSDDFAAARNAALALVKTEWLLSIDADEELKLDRSDALAIAFAASPDPYAIWVRSEDVGQGTPTKIARIFKNVGGAHWELPIHEMFVQPGHEDTPPVDASAMLCLLHHGYGPDRAPAKMERNLRILAAQLEADPDSPTALFYFARECAYSGKHEDGLAAAERLVDEFELGPERLADTLALAAWHALALHRPERVLEFTKEARRLSVPTVWSEYFRGVALVSLNQFPKALEAAERACAMSYPERSLIALPEVWHRKRFDLRTLILGRR